MPTLKSEQDIIIRDDLARRETLLEFFAYNEYPEKIAIIYDGGESSPIHMTYNQVNNLADNLKHHLEGIDKHTPGGFIGVACSQNCIFPVILIGVMRAACAFYNLDECNLVEDIKFAQLVLHMQTLVIEESIYQRASSKTKSFLIQHKIEECEYVCDEINNFRVNLLIFGFRDNAHRATSVTAPSLQFAFAIKTTGTTGSKKMVLVPNACIVPNVSYFIQYVWKMNENDVVFGAAAPSFDPHVIELFTALGSGAAILYAPKRLKLDGESISKILMKHKTTILQITPSLFRRIEKHLVAEDMFIESKTSLEVLAFGGEKCLEKDVLREIISTNMFKKLKKRGLQNLYGITEVSCWASVECIDLESDREITIGTPIMDTCIHIDSNGYISIGSTSRICTILTSRGELRPCSFRRKRNSFFETGDIGRMIEGNAITYLSRKDRSVKRNGYKISLVQIENIALSSKQLKTAHCTFYEDKIYLVIVFKNESDVTAIGRVKEEFIPALLMDIPPQIYPDVIVPVKEIPVNENGKIDIRRILFIADRLRIMESQQNDTPQAVFTFQRQSFLSAFKNIWSMCTHSRGKVESDFSQESDKAMRFVESGGDSLSAVRFIEEIFTYLKLFGSEFHAKYQKEIMKVLLLETYGKVEDFFCDIALHHPIEVKVNAVQITECDMVSEDTIVEYTCDNKPSELSKPLNHENPFDTVAESILKRKLEGKTTHLSIGIQNPPMIKSSWSHDLKMCVDASAAIATDSRTNSSPISVIGSHSGYAVAVTLNPALTKKSKKTEFTVIWEVQLEGRIEATATIHPNHLLVFMGTHNKRLYCLSLTTGCIHWRFESDGAVRASPIISEDGISLIFLDDENSIYCLNCYDGTLLWRNNTARLISTCGPSLAAENSVFITSLPNAVSAFNVRNGSKLWTRGSEALYITAPCLIKSKENTFVLMGTRAGQLDALHSESGKLIWSNKDIKMNKISSEDAPFAAEVHHCCQNEDPSIIFMNRCGDGVVICPLTGTSVRLFHLNQRLTSPPTCVCTLNIFSDVSPTGAAAEVEEPMTKIKRKLCTEYMVFYGLNSESVITFIDINDFSRLDIDAKFDTHTENFSKVVVYNNFLFVGGRDNKLHLFELECFRATEFS